MRRSFWLIMILPVILASACRESAKIREARKHAMLVALVSKVPETYVSPPVSSRKVFHSSADIAACVRNKDCHVLLTVDHQTLGFKAPGNSRAAVRAAVAVQVPVIEIDIRFSRDRKLYLTHGDELHDTTNLRGKLMEMDPKQLAHAILSNGETLPTFGEIYAISRGKSVLYLDCKENVIGTIADWFARYGSFDDGIFYAGYGEEEIQTAAAMKRKYPQMLVSVRFDSLEDFRGAFGGLPDVVEIGLPDKKNIDFLHRLGVKVYATSTPFDTLPTKLKAKVPTMFYLSNSDFVETNTPLVWMQ